MNRVHSVNGEASHVEKVNEGKLAGGFNPPKYDLVLSNNHPMIDNQELFEAPNQKALVSSNTARSCPMLGFLYQTVDENVTLR